MLRLPHFLDNRLTDGGEDVSLTHPEDNNRRIMLKWTLKKQVLKM
jgi:hypothetical protein